MKKQILFTLIALFAMVVSANATDYTGEVTNVMMNGKLKSNVQNVTFSINNNVLSGNFDIATAHSLDINVPLTVTGKSFVGKGDGTITFVIIPISFTCDVDGSLDGKMTFNCEAVTDSGITASFTFTED